MTGKKQEKLREKKAREGCNKLFFRTWESMHSGLSWVLSVEVHVQGAAMDNMETSLFTQSTGNP